VAADRESTVPSSYCKPDLKRGCIYLLSEAYILENILPPWRGEKYQPMSFGGKNMKRQREKEGECKRKRKKGKEKGRKGKENEKRENKRVK
jgi:hypothetical protein